MLIRITIIFFKMIFSVILNKWVNERTCYTLNLCCLPIVSTQSFDSIQTLTELWEFIPLVNSLRNDNSCCCCTKETKTESSHHECRICRSHPAGSNTDPIQLGAIQIPSSWEQFRSHPAGSNTDPIQLGAIQIPSRWAQYGEHRIYRSHPGGRNMVSIESTDPIQVGAIW